MDNQWLENFILDLLHIVFIKSIVTFSLNKIIKSFKSIIKYLSQNELFVYYELTRCCQQTIQREIQAFLVWI